MKMQATFTSSSKNIKNLENRLIKLINVDAGIFEGKTAREGGLTNAFILSVHENGSITNNIPQRSILRKTIHTKKNEITQTAKKMITEKGKNSQAKIRAKILSSMLECVATEGFGSWAKLKPSTIKAKGGRATILIDTGQMARSLDVREGKI